MKRTRSYSPYTLDAGRLLGARIAQGRRDRRWTQSELAERTGISKPTLARIERGDPTVGVGVMFEAAALVGVPLFHQDRSRLTADVDAARERLALLPQQVRRDRRPVKDDF